MTGMESDMKQCSKCGEHKPLGEYHRDKHSKDGYVQRCKACVKIKTKEWLLINAERDRQNQRKKYALNPEKYKAKSKKWNENNKERKAANDKLYQTNNPHVYRATKQRRKIRKAQNGKYQISAKEWAKLYASPCIYCGSTENTQADHVIPIARGGVHGIGNLVPACKHCNASKRQRTITEWKKTKRNPA
jgi:5-methylcytosine-specific restriction endonuclease McrA